MPWIKHPNVELPAEVPESSMSHWLSLDWEECEPPEHRRPRRDRRAAADTSGTSEKPAAPAVETPAGAAAPPGDDTSSTETAPPTTAPPTTAPPTTAPRKPKP